MKLLYFLGSFYPAQTGGPSNTTYWAAKELVRRGGDVTVVSLKDGLTSEHYKHYGISLNIENDVDGVKAWYFDYVLSRYFSGAMFFWLLRNLKQYDMVNLTSIFFPWTWVASVLCVIYGVPFTIAPRGELEPGAYKYGRFRKNLIFFVFIKRIMSRARFVLVTSEQEEKYSRPYFPDAIPFETLPNYMDVDYGFVPDEVVVKKKDILYLGRIHPKKGVENLISAFNLVNIRDLGEHRLLIVGDGDVDYLRDLRSLAKSTDRGAEIYFLGHMEGLEKQCIYQNAKVMVLPSYSENFGNVVVESLSYATPVIASSLTPWAELEKAGCGRWVENDPNSLANAIESILSLNQDEYISMSIAAHNFARDSYDISKNGEKLERLFSGYLS